MAFTSNFIRSLSATARLGTIGKFTVRSGKMNTMQPFLLRSSENSL